MLRADTLVVILGVFLLVSVLANIYQWYRWHSYRTKSAGLHSHTGMMPKVDRDQILRDRKRREEEKEDDKWTDG